MVQRLFGALPSSGSCFEIKVFRGWGWSSDPVLSVPRLWLIR